MITLDDLYQQYPKELVDEAGVDCGWNPAAMFFWLRVDKYYRAKVAAK